MHSVNKKRALNIILVLLSQVCCHVPHGFLLAGWSHEQTLIMKKFISKKAFLSYYRINWNLCKIALGLKFYQREEKLLNAIWAFLGIHQLREQGSQRSGLNHNQCGQPADPAISEVTWQGGLGHDSPQGTGLSDSVILQWILGWGLLIRFP